MLEYKKHNEKQNEQSITQLISPMFYSTIRIAVAVIVATLISTASATPLPLPDPQLCSKSHATRFTFLLYISNIHSKLPLLKVRTVVHFKELMVP